jgi:hypothetical protein
MLTIPIPSHGSHEDPLTEIGISADLATGQLESLATIGGAGDSSGPQSKLFRYWTHGAGAAKIRWGTDGSFARCKRFLGKHLPPNYSLGGLCANLHKRATGEWPTEHGKAGIPS